MKTPTFEKYLGGVMVITLDPACFPEELNFMFILIGPRTEWRIVTTYTQDELSSLATRGALERILRDAWIAWYCTPENHHGRPIESVA